MDTPDANDAPSDGDSSSSVAPITDTVAGSHDALADRDMSIDRIWTIPNVLTFIRMCAIPVFLFLLFSRDRPGPAGFLLGILSMTDWVDGYIARRFNQVSNFGKMFDPIVDRALLVFCIGGIIVWGGVPLWLGVIVVIREVALSLFVIYITVRGVPRIDVTWFGKKGTFFIMMAFPSILISTDELWPEWVVTFYRILGWASVPPGLLFSAIAFVQYVRIGTAELRKRKAAG